MVSDRLVFKPISSGKHLGVNWRVIPLVTKRYAYVIETARSTKTYAHSKDAEKAAKRKIERMQ